MNRNFKALGISHKNTPLEVREAVTFDESGSKRFLKQLKEVLGVEEALILSTCNRTEIYYIAEETLTDQITSLVDLFHGLQDKPSAPYFKPFTYQEAVRQLFRVSLGLDSRVLGDIQITNQVKKAYQWSADESLAGPFLHRLLHTIFYTNKRMVQETPFRDGTASLASVAVEISQHFISQYAQPRIAVIGLGDIGANVAENLKGTTAEVVLVNRTEEKAESLAQELGFAHAPISELANVVASAHVVISAVVADSPIITHEMTATSNQPRLFVDLSVPRSIEEEVGQVAGALVYNVDQLQQKASGALERRKAAIPQVESILEESLAEFEDWAQEMEVSPTIKKFKMALEEIRQQELARYVGKMDERELKVLDKVTKGMIQKVIKLPVLQLKAACKRGEAETLVGVLNDLFNLGRKVNK